VEQEFVGKYRLVRQLAKGGLAEIYVFLDELRIASQLSHPNIARTFDGLSLEF
jgi:hypothetical protein